MERGKDWRGGEMMISDEQLYQMGLFPKKEDVIPLVKEIRQLRETISMLPNLSPEEVLEENESLRSENETLKAIPEGVISSMSEGKRLVVMLKSSNEKLRAQLADATQTMKVVQAMCGDPNAADGCRHILEVTRVYLENHK